MCMYSCVTGARIMCVWGGGGRTDPGRGWAGLGWAGLGWAGLGWAGLGWAGLESAAPLLPTGAHIEDTHSCRGPQGQGWTGFIMHAYMGVRDGQGLSCMGVRDGQGLSCMHAWG